MLLQWVAAASLSSAALLVVWLWPRRLLLPKNAARVKRRTLVVGAGAAGTAAAWALTRDPALDFEVDVWEASSVPGGVATSEAVESTFINDGVQGAAPSYHNTLALHALFGFVPTPVHMMISFGKGRLNWNNYPDQETELTRRLQPEIRRFGRLLRVISRLEPLFVCISISLVLRLGRFSADFRNLMVFPLVALFFGTGNQTPSVSAAIVARVFQDPQLRLFEYDEKALLSQTPRMLAFSRLSEIYAAIYRTIPARLHCNRAVARVQRHVRGVYVMDTHGQTVEFDDIIFTCSAEVALRVLEEPSWLERRVLGNVRYFDDVTVTHQDQEYMHQHYDLDPTRNDQYFIHTDPQDRGKIEMSFNLSNYQPQLSRAAGSPIFQTIFLDKDNAQTWTIARICKEKILLTKKWRQFAHTWSHFAFSVPFFRFLQGW